MTRDEERINDVTSDVIESIRKRRAELDLFTVLYLYYVKKKSTTSHFASKSESTDAEKITEMQVATVRVVIPL